MGLGHQVRLDLGGHLYLASVIDCFSRKVVGWSMRADMEAELVVDALEMAINRRQPAGSWSITPTRARNTSR